PSVRSRSMTCPDRSPLTGRLARAVRRRVAGRCTPTKNSIVENSDRGVLHRGAMHTTCVVAGGGPAGVMLGWLLARAGVPVGVLEKHADFLRDFRGDTIHPSTLRVMSELGVLDEFLRLPHRKVRYLRADFGGRMVTLGDFGLLPRFGYLAFMPQRDFLDFAAGR